MWKGASCLLLFYRMVYLQGKIFRFWILPAFHISDLLCLSILFLPKRTRLLSKDCAVMLERIVQFYYQRWLLRNTFRLFGTIKIMVPLEIFNFLELLIEEASLWSVVVSVSIVKFWLREQGNILWRTSVPFCRNILAIALLMLVSCRTCDISFITVKLLLCIWNLLFSVKLFYASQVFSTLEATTSVFLLIFFK